MWRWWRRYGMGVVGTLGLLGTAGTVSAQSVGFGVKGGANLANFWGDNVGHVEIRTRRTGGAFLTFKATPTFSIQVEALYAEKGAKETETVFDPQNGQVISGSVKWDYDYVDVPVLLRFHVPTSGAVRPSLYLGPVVSFLVKSKVAGVDIKKFTKTTDIGGTIGGTLELGTGPIRILMDLRYTLGLEPFDTKGAELIFSRKHNTISAMAGFVLGGK